MLLCRTVKHMAQGAWLWLWWGTFPWQQPSIWERTQHESPRSITERSLALQLVPTAASKPLSDTRLLPTVLLRTLPGHLAATVGTGCGVGLIPMVLLVLQRCSCHPDACLQPWEVAMVLLELQDCTSRQFGCQALRWEQQHWSPRVIIRRSPLL